MSGPRDPNLPAFDTVIRGGTVATASDVFSADLGLHDGRIAAIGLDLAPGRREIDATGKLVLPGGVDSLAHIEQLSASGLMNAEAIPVEEQEAIGQAVERRLEGQLRQPDGSWVADYVRLRFTMRKPL